MPLYEWKCEKCGLLTVIVKPAAEYDIPPEACDPEAAKNGEKNEKGEPLYTKPESCGHTGPEGWKKHFGKTSTAFGPNWHTWNSGGKGNW
jgi:hypothetical protein